MGWKTNGFASFYHVHGENSITIHLFKVKVFEQNLRSILTRQTITWSRITECSKTRSWTSSIGMWLNILDLFPLSLLPTLSINISVWMMWNISKLSAVKEISDVSIKHFVYLTLGKLPNKKKIRTLTKLAQYASWIIYYLLLYSAEAFVRLETLSEAE